MEDKLNHAIVFTLFIFFIVFFGSIETHLILLLALCLFVRFAADFDIIYLTDNLLS